MSKWTCDEALNAGLDVVASANKLVVCAGQPVDFWEAADAAAWVAETPYIIDAAVRPMVDRNGFTYVCTTAGISAASEPVWPTTPGETVTDGTVVWTCYTCRALSSVALASGDFSREVVADGIALTVAAKTGMTVHTTGTADHLALIRTSDHKLISITTIPEQVVTSGNAIATNSYIDLNKRFCA